MKLPVATINKFAGTRIEWVDADPVNGDGETNLGFRFYLSLRSIDRLLLQKQGFRDVLQCLDFTATWRIVMSVEFENDGEIFAIEKGFLIRAKRFPWSIKFEILRDDFFVYCRLAELNSSQYRTTRFVATCAGA